MNWAPTEQEYKAVKGRQKRARKAIEDVREHQHVLTAGTEDLLAEARREQGGFVPPMESPQKVIRLTDFSPLAQEIEEKVARQQAANESGRGAVVAFPGQSQTEKESEREYQQQAARRILEAKEQDDEDAGEVDNAERLTRQRRAARALMAEEE